MTRHSIHIAATILAGAVSEDPDKVRAAHKMALEAGFKGDGSAPWGGMLPKPEDERDEEGAWRPVPGTEDVACLWLVDQFVNATKYYGCPLTAGAMYFELLHHLWEPTLAALT